MSSHPYMRSCHALFLFLRLSLYHRGVIPLFEGFHCEQIGVCIVLILCIYMLTAVLQRLRLMLTASPRRRFERPLILGLQASPSQEYYTPLLYA